MPNLTVYTASRGTSETGPGGQGENSSVGHTWYSIGANLYQSNSDSSFGFAPDLNHQGSPFSPGAVYQNDTKNYNSGDTNGLYQVVTVPITWAQYK